MLMPTHQIEGVFGETARHLYELDPQPDRYIFSENNSTDATLELISKFDAPKELIRVWFQDHAMNHPRIKRDIIAVMRQFLLQRARHLNPDFALFLDSDIWVLSRDLISRLTRWGNSGIIAGPVTLFNAILGPLLSVRLLADRKPSGHPPLVEVAGAGTGCMMLPRKIIQDRRLNFYPILGHDVYSEDMAYCESAGSLGYKVFVDWSVDLDHLRRPTAITYGEFVTPTTD